MKKTKLLAILLILIVGLGFGISHLFILQLKKGAQYPPYSTLRTDPLGARLFFETLQQWSNGKTGQILNRTWEKPSGKNTTWILLDAREIRTLFNKRDGAGLQEFLKEGGRCVIAFEAQEAFKPRATVTTITPEKTELTKSPETDQPQETLTTPTDPSPTDEIQKKAEKERKDREEAEREQELFFEKNYEDLEKVWGFEIASNPILINDSKALKEKQSPVYAIAHDHWNGESLPQVPWRSTNYFVLGNTDWKIRYTLNDKPVIIEREFNGGSILLLTDPSLMSNESLMKESHWRPLIPVIGSGRSYWFDETHLKVERRLSLMQLIHHFHGSGLLLGILITFLLWVWKNQSILAPLPISLAEQSRKIATPLQNMTQLFQRNLNLTTLWNEMIREWALHHSNHEIEAAADRAKKHLSARLLQNPIPPPSTLYQEITEILNERKKHGNAS